MSSKNDIFLKLYLSAHIVKLQNIKVKKKHHKRDLREKKNRLSIRVIIKLIPDFSPVTIEARTQ